MIRGVGIDLVKIDRVREVVEKWGKKFLDKVYTEAEISYCYGKKDPYLSLAVRFAAKEALIKAIGAGAPLSFTDIEVINYETGKPAFRISGRLKEFFASRPISGAHLSLSHEHDYGVACVVVEG